MNDFDRLGYSETVKRLVEKINTANPKRTTNQNQINNFFAVKTRDKNS